MAYVCLAGAAVWLSLWSAFRATEGTPASLVPVHRYHRVQAERQAFRSPRIHRGVRAVRGRTGGGVGAGCVRNYCQGNRCSSYGGLRKKLPAEGVITSKSDPRPSAATLTDRALFDACKQVWQCMFIVRASGGSGLQQCALGLRSEASSLQSSHHPLAADFTCSQHALSWLHS